MPDKDHATEDEYIGIIREMVKDLRFGSVMVTVQNSRVIQIEKSEKIRLKN